MYILGPFLIKQLFHSRLLDIRSALRASLAIYHLKSNARLWDYCLLILPLASRFATFWLGRAQRSTF